MFTLSDYVGPHSASPDWTAERQAHAKLLIIACGDLQQMMLNAGVHFQINPKTGTTISGNTYGGFRPQDCPQGAAHSAHKEGQAVDRYDPDGSLDAWIMAHQEALVQCGIYIEHPSTTIGWSHWSIRAPESKHHVFFP